MKKILSFLLMLFMSMSMLADNLFVTWPGTQSLPGELTMVGEDSHVKIMVSSTNTYSNPIRIYANTTVTIKADDGYVLKSVTYESSSTGNYVTNAQNATVTPNVTPTVDGKNVTWTFTTDPVEFTFKPSAQTRSNGITIEYAYTGETPPEPPTPTITEVSTVAEFNALTDNTEFKFTADLTCVKQHNNTLYLQEGDKNYAGNAILIYGNVGQTYETTDVIPGGWTGKKTTYNNFPEVVSPDGFLAAEGNNNIKPTELDLVSVNSDTEDWGKYVVAKNVLIVLEETPEPPQPTGDEIIFDFNNGLSELGLETPDVGKGINLENPITYNGITMNFTNGGTATRIWNSSGTTTLRVYKNGGSLTFSTSLGNFTEITFDGTISGTFDTGTMNWNTKVWTGNSSMVTFTNGDSNNSTINKIIFKVASSTRNQTVTKEFVLKDPETGYTLKAYPQTFGGAELPDDLTQLYDVYGVLNFHSGEAEILPMGIMQGDNVITDNIDVIENSVKKVLYYNIQGISSEKPFDGVNIVVTEYSNGDKKITKQIYKLN